MVYMLRRHHEVAALRAAGLSMVACCLPIWLMGALFAALCFWFGEGVAPRCAARAEEIHDRWTRSVIYREKGKARLAFTNHDERRDWYFEVFEPYGPQFGVLVKQFRRDGSTAWELQAARADHDGDRWIFRRGQLSIFDAQGELPEGSERRFETFRTASLGETPARITHSLRPVEELSVLRMLHLLKLNRQMPASLRRVFVATIWYRLAFPFSCVVAPLFGVSCSLTNERGGALRGFATAVGCMVLYYLVSQLFLVFGRSGLVPVFVGGALPTLVFLACGIRNMYLKR
jgi:lipopolysaccharide export LptBFGC system permease protein LptF